MASTLRAMAQGLDVFAGRGELARLIRDKDWSETSLGATGEWPPSLVTVLRLMLSSRYAMWLGWGPELTFFYNDAYAQQTLAEKHPWALGQPAAVVWAEIWHALQPRIQHVLQTGEATWDEGLQLFLERSGYSEETYHTFSYSPAPAGSLTEIGGLFCVVIEDTERVIAERRMVLLRTFAAGLAGIQSADAVFEALRICLSDEARDLPFSITYLLSEDGKAARRVCQTGFDEWHPGAPPRIELGELGELGETGLWPLDAVLTGRAPTVVDLPPTFEWPRGAWAQSPKRALALPIARQGERNPAGIFIAGLNPHRPFDDGFRSFVELFVGQLTAALSNAGAYEAAQQRAEALAQIDRAKTAFFSNVSHEFRTPLTLMLGPTQDALGSPARALSGADLETVYRNELRLLKLVNGLLDFARIEAGRAKATYQATDLRAFTVDLASMFRSAIERAGLEFIVDCEELPEPIYVDHDMWEKIVLNLLSNALKFTFAGHIAMRLRWRDGLAQLDVEDTGVGVAAAELPRLFERFHRIEGTRARTHEGSGIGLALVHELVRLHGGSIEVESELERGTSFRIAIPSGKAHLPAAHIGPPQALAPSTAYTAHVEEALRWIRHPGSADLPTIVAPKEPAVDAARILVADDNADMREYITRLLSQHWVVEAVSDGVEALEAMSRQLPDLLITDVMMPRLDGFGLIRDIRNDPAMAATPIIVLSARAGEEATAEGLRAGADDYLLKPFSATALLVRVEAQLSAARLRQTLRRRAESERQRLDTIFRESPAAISLMRGPELRIELANPLILQIWGKSGAVIGQPFLDAVPEIRGQGYDRLLTQVLETGVPCHGKEALAEFDRRGDGQLQGAYFDFVYAPFPDPDGTINSVFVHAYEVTDQVLARRNADRLREAEQRARHDAEVANRLKDEFLATMSHELRTPLNAILGWAALLRRSKQDGPSLERGLATIERNAHAQARLIDDVLDVSRIISGKLRLDLGRVDLNAVSNAALDVVRPAADARGVRLVAEHDAQHDLDLVGDADRLQQVVWNLLSNAVKFTAAGGSVTLRIERKPKSLRIIVQDTGSGIAPEHLPYIFERFRQVDSSTTRKHGGLGLGLAIVRHLVELHGGAVSAESAGEGLGATFTVELPVGLLETSPVEVLPESEAATKSDIPPSVTLLRGLKILVVDDDEDSRLLLQTALERLGASVQDADSAAQAFAMFHEQKQDVVISDIGMPGEDGISLVKRLRASRGGERVLAIALTAYARETDVSSALAAGFQVHFSKPVNIDELARSVAERMERATRSPVPA